MNTGRECSKCKKGRLERTKRARFVKIFLFWLPIRRYKCDMCGRKVYLFNTHKHINYDAHTT
jgi:hypothetical protein